MNTVFADKLNGIIAVFGCSNTEFEHATGYNRSSLSRFRNGSRIPDVNSKSLYSLSEQIFSYADSNNLIDELRITCDCKDIKGKVKTIAAISEWLCDGSEKQETPPKPRQHKEKKTTGCFFGDKLNAVMEMLALSNVRLGKLVSLDPSYISRFRMGIRVPTPDTELTNGLCHCLVQRIVDTEKQSELAALMHKPEELLSGDIDDVLPIFSDWIFDIKSDRESIAVDTFLANIDIQVSHNSQGIIPLDMMSVDCIKTEYFGTDGIREAVIRFLSSTAKIGNIQLSLYSDRSMDWMIGDSEYFAKWHSLMIHNLRAGVRIRIIHNIDRGIEEMLAAIEGWLPLYMSGLIDAYICKKPLNSRFSHTMFLSEKQCVTSFSVRTAEENAFCAYSENKEDTSRNIAEFNKLLESCGRLIRVYSSQDFESLQLRIETLQNQSGALRFMSHSLSIATMTDELLCKILDRNNIVGEERRRLTEFHRVSRELFVKSLENGEVFEYVPFAEDESLLSGNAHIDFDCAAPEKALFYTDEEYSEHIKSIQKLLDEHTNYHIYALPTNPFENIELMIKGGTIAVLKTSSSPVAMLFEQPLMQNAFEEYFRMIGERCIKERSEVALIMERFI